MNGDCAWPESLKVETEFLQQRESILDALDIACSISTIAGMSKTWRGTFLPARAPSKLHTQGAHARHADRQ